MTHKIFQQTFTVRTLRNLAIANYRKPSKIAHRRKTHWSKLIGVIDYLKLSDDKLVCVDDLYDLPSIGGETMKTVIDALHYNKIIEY